MSRKSESEAPMDGCQWRGLLSQLKRWVFIPVLKVSNVPEIADASKYIVPGSRCRYYKGVSVEVKRRMRPYGCARAPCPQRLVLKQVTCEVSRCSSVDGSKCYGPELEVNMLTDRQPMQLPPQLGGTETTWRLNKQTRGRASSGHVEGGRSCAEKCRRADCCSSRDVHRRYWLRQIWQHRCDVDGCGVAHVQGGPKKWYLSYSYNVI